MASGVPIILINAIPGQEEENAEVMEENNVAIWIKKDDNIEEKLNDIIYNNEKLEELKQNVLKYAKPNSSKDVCEIIIKNVIE